MIEEYYDMEMPTPCENCGKWFDLLDGGKSRDYPNITVCPDCTDANNPTDDDSWFKGTDCAW
jgi:hypothetical protein